MNRPVLLSGHTLAARATLEAAKCAVKLADEGLSTASMTLAPGSARVEIGDWLRIVTPQGKRMVMVVTATGTDTDAGDAQTVEAEHVFALLRDSQCGEINADQQDISAADAIRALMGCQKEPIWQLGTCEYTDALPWSFKRQSVYEGLETVTSCLDDPRWALDTDAMPFTAHLLRHSDAPACELRKARNLSAMRVRRERAGMVTRVIPVGMDDLGIEEVNGGVPYIEKNADRYGIIEQTITNPAIDNARVLRAWGAAQLHKSCQPVTTISITGRELSARTGLDMDRLTVGTVCRVAARGGPITARIAQLEWRDAIAEPESVAVTLSTKQRTVQSVVRRLQSEAAETKRGGGGSGAKQKKENENLWTRITQTDEEIKLQAYRLDQRIDGTVENIAALTVRADEIKAQVTRAEATANANALSISTLKVTADAIEGVVEKYNYTDAGDLLEGYRSNITQNADNIELRVAKTDYNGATIASLINIGTNDILIKSGRIDLQGYVTMSEFQAEIASIKITDSSYVTTAALTTQSLDAHYAEIDSMNLGGNQVSLKSLSVVTGVSGKASGEIAVRDASGTIIGSAITGYKVSYSTTDIYYMSWE